MDFFWLIPQKIAGGSLPRSISDINKLHKKRIQHIISLIIDTTNIQKLFTNCDIKLHHIPIPDLGIPSYSQIQLFFDLVSDIQKNNEAIFVHCYGGCGRTGTILALYLVHLGHNGVQALKEIRSLQPCSVETEEQENLVLNFLNDDKRLRNSHS